MSRETFLLQASSLKTRELFFPTKIWLIIKDPECSEIHLLVRKHGFTSKVVLDLSWIKAQRRCDVCLCGG